ncbi:MAG: EamA family transporter [Bacteroidales bacterium]|jgi:small multidrug resistance pump|nr:EamA family transporter [Bacteroidales bacterium]
MKSYLFLLGAILCETVATTFLKKTEQFTNLIPTVIFIIGMVSSFYLLSFALREISVGIAYAIWSAVGIVLISVISYFVYKQHLDFPAILGISLIIIGVIVINLFSKSTVH